MALTLLKGYLEGDWVTLIEEVKDHENLDLLLRATVDLLVPKLSVPSPNPRHVQLWETLRPLFGTANLTTARVVSAFLLADRLSL